jgi:CDGSH iron-sulfur domain-containing protein 3
METIPNKGLPRIAKKEPAGIAVETGKIYSWCSCGLTEKEPFCDSSHKIVEGMPFKSVKVTFDKAEEVWFCQCKQTKTPPFCDGSHKDILVESSSGLK